MCSYVSTVDGQTKSIKIVLKRIKKISVARQYRFFFCEAVSTWKEEEFMDETQFNTERYRLNDNSHHNWIDSQICHQRIWHSFHFCSSIHTSISPCVAGNYVVSYHFSH